MDTAIAIKDDESIVIVVEWTLPQPSKMMRAL